MIHSAQSNLRIIHKGNANDWILQVRAHQEQIISLRLILANEKSDHELDQLIQGIADVSSSQYGKYYTLDQLQKVWGPSIATLDALKAFQAVNDIKLISNDLKDHWQLTASVQDIEKIFQTKLYVFKHFTHHDLEIIRPKARYFMPKELEKHIIYIDGMDSFHTKMQVNYMRSSINAVDDKVADRLPYQPNLEWPLATPEHIRRQYDVPGEILLKNGSNPRNTLIIGSFLQEVYSENDLQQFLFEYGLHQQTSTIYPITTGDCLVSGRSRNATTGEAATGEASLDIQVAVSLARGGNIEMACYSGLRNMSLPSSDGNQEPFLSFMQDVNLRDPPPGVVSISYADDECAVPKQYVDVVNREFMKAALKGITVVAASGDAGVQGSSLASYCQIASCTKYVAQFPASSPYVLAVGATSFDGRVPLINGKYNEIATSTASNALITTGGGFSSYFAQPTYQSEIVSAYLKDNELSQNLSRYINASGRAYPDITAVGHKFPTIVNGEMDPTDGTSVSTPVVASLIVLLNENLLSRNRSVVGFFNPLLYKLHEVCPHVLRDITQGNSACGVRRMSCCATGLQAGPGWDPVSGVGTLQMAPLIESFSNCIDHIKQSQQHSSLMSKAQLNRDSSFFFKHEELLFFCFLGLLVAIILKKVNSFYDQRNQRPSDAVDNNETIPLKRNLME